MSSRRRNPRKRPGPGESPKYKKSEDLKEVKRWCELYPWYASLIDDIRATLAARSRTGAEYSMPTSARRTRSNAA